MQMENTLFPNKYQSFCKCLVTGPKWSKLGRAPENDPYLGNGPYEKVVAPGILVTKIAVLKQKIDFWPQISKFWGLNCTFSSLAANWSLNGRCFQHERGVSLGSGFVDFWPKNRPNWAQNWDFWPNIGIFGPIDPVPSQEN